MRQLQIGQKSRPSTASPNFYFKNLLQKILIAFSHQQKKKTVNTTVSIVIRRSGPEFGGKAEAGS